MIEAEDQSPMFMGSNSDDDESVGMPSFDLQAAKEALKPQKEFKIELLA